MFHNVATLSRHYDCVRADYALMRATVIVLAECHTKMPRDRNAYPLNGFTCLHMTGSDRDGMSNGLALYVKDENVNACRFVADNSPNSDGIYSTSSDIVEMGLMKFYINTNKIAYLCFVYRHPKASDFWHQLKDFLTRHLSTRLMTNCRIKDRLILVGDFNIDLLDLESDKRIKEKIEKDLGLEQLVVMPTTDRGTCIDWCATNIEQENYPHKVIVYESFFSDHKPLWLYVKNKEAK